MFTVLSFCPTIYKVFFKIIYTEKGLPSLDAIIIPAVRMKYKVSGSTITYICSTPKCLECHLVLAITPNFL